MRKSISYHIESLTALQSSFRAYGKVFSEWNEARRSAANARMHANVCQRLDARLQHDVGERDCQPQPESLSSLQWDDVTRLEAMRYRSI
jgi:hypothetical protein